MQEKATGENNTFTFALISDSHTFYNDLDDAVLAINENENVDIVIHGGDLTDGGMIKEYEIFHNIAS
ncbi:MAG: metallophosphoesterase [Bacteroidales bacterium]|nr:metallophosphoesterase [Bacteroidales bacterium]